MFTMTLLCDPKKVLKDGRYSVEEFNTLLREICLETRFKEKAPGNYYLEETEDELGRMIVLATKIDKIKGEMLLKKWVTHSDYEGRVNQLK